MTAVDDLPPLRDVIAAHDLRAEKKLGQNFLLDLNLTEKIARQAGDLSGVHVFEIGPGPGGLTRALVKSDAAHITAIEFDPRAVEALQDLKEAAQGRLDIVEADALKADLLPLAKTGQIAVAANLPYNIATPLLIQWLEMIYDHPGRVRSMTLMFQKEVAQRITAQVKTKSYGRLSVLSQWLCETKICFDLPPAAFTPAPKVTSSVVQFVPKEKEQDAPAFKAVEKITEAAFGQRRKMIRSSLKDYADLFEDCGLDETKRAEELSVDDFIKLAKARL